jgi:glycerol kinase
MGVWKSIDNLKNVNTEGRTVFQSKISDRKREKMYGGWKEAITRSFGWADVVGDDTDDDC